MTERIERTGLVKYDAAECREVGARTCALRVRAGRRRVGSVVGERGRWKAARMSEPYRAPCQLCKGTRIIRRLFGRAPMRCPWCCDTDPTSPGAREQHVGESGEQWARAA